VIEPDAFAALLCDWCLEVQGDQQILIACSTLGEPLARSLHNAILDRDAWPLLRLAPTELAADFHRHAADRHLDSFAPLELIETQTADAVLAVNAPANTRALAGVDPGRLTRAATARRPIQEARLSKRWCGTLWPTAALAQDARMSDADYTAFVERALFLDQPDPVGAWRDLSKRQAAIVEMLSTVSELRIEAEGTDLTLRVEGRTWVNSDGRRNMPSGEVFTGPLEDSTTGTIRFTVPSSPRGVEVAGVELTFRDGEVVAQRAERGQDYLLAALNTDPGARYLGELGIGTNSGIDRPTGTILLDEKIAETVHLALGRSYPETGGRNTSALHWDLICDLRNGGRISADGQMLNDKLWGIG
jgi:aminopeptidase